MKKILLILIMYFITCSAVQAFNFKGAAWFLTGISAGIVAHESAHSLAVISQGGEVIQQNFIGVSYSITGKGSSTKETRADVNRKGRIISLAGYAANALAAEIVYHKQSWHDNDFALGWAFMGLSQNIVAPIAYYVFNDQSFLSADLRHYRDDGGDPAVLSAFLLGHSFFTLYRVFKKTDIPLHITQNTLGLQFKF